ncbi:MAG: hypothetical protein E6Q59_00145 [Nitrosomonas sp.]|nr:MAG: hypothetical protein E6Q59_00145 [Nitrosomonas sp.]
MAISSTQQTEILKIVVGLFNAAPGGVYLSELAKAVENGMSPSNLADALAASPVFTAGILAGNVTIDDQVDVLMKNFGVTADSDPASAGSQAKTYFTEQITNGVGFGQIVFDAVTFLSTTTDTNFAAAKTLLDNKAMVAEAFSKISKSTDLTVLQQVLSKVTGDAPYTATDVARVIADSGAAEPVGKTYTLTEGVDNIPGTVGDDTIIAGEGSSGGAHTLGASDLINGGDGTDTIDIKMVGDNLIPRMSSVEKVFAQALGTVPDTINMVNATGIQELWSKNSTNDLDVTNLQEKAVVGVKGGNGSDYTVQAAAAALTGDLAIVLDGANVGDLFVNSTGAAGGAGYASVTINAVTGNNAITGIAGTETNDIATLDAGATLATVKVIGDGAVRVTNDLAATVRTIDALVNKGGVNLSIANNTGNVTFTGGTGADRINFSSTLNLNDKVDGGDSRDILGVFNQASIITGLQVSNVEILELNTLNGVLEAGRIASVDEVRVTTNLDDVPGTAVVNGLSSNSTFVTNDSGDVRLNLTNAQAAGTNDTLNLKTGIAGVGSANVMAAGVETVAYTQDNEADAGADTTVNFYDTDGVVDLSTLSIGSKDGNTVRFNDLVNTIKTVNASAALGDVNVSISAGNPTSGVSITGGAGDDILRGGDGKDVIVAGAGDDNVSGDIVTLIPGTGGAAIPQQSTVTIANEEAGEQFSVTISGAGFNTYTVTSTGAGTAAGLLATAIADAGGIILGSSATGSVLTLDGLATGDFFSVSTSTTNVAAVPAVAESSTVTIDDAAPYDAGDVLRVTINGINFDHTTVAGESAATAAAALAASINGAGQMTAAVVDTVGVSSVITLTGTNVATDYTVTASMPTEVSAGIPAVPSTATITPTGLIAGTTLSITIGINVFTQVFNTDAATTLADFVTTNGAAISTLTGGVLTSTLTDDLLITNAGGTGLSGGAISGAITGGVGAVSVVSVPGSAAVAQTDNVDPVAVDNAPTPAVPAGVDDQTADVNTIIPGQASADQYVAGASAADILTGGDGKDAFWLLSGSNGWDGTSFTTMDTITDLNLGGATAILGVDTFNLNSAVFGPFGATDLINAGASLAMTGPNLGGAVQALFNAGGALSGSLNDVGLFTYGSDTYLVATDNVAGLDANDVIVKVTGVTGTLDLSDIAVI